MAQAEIIKCLKNENEPLARREIAFLLDMNLELCSKALNKLLRWSEIKCIEIDRFEAKERFSVNRRMLLYYI